MAIHTYVDLRDCCTDARKFVDKTKARAVVSRCSTHFSVLFPDYTEEEIYTVSLEDAYRSAINCDDKDKELFLPLIGKACVKDRDRRMRVLTDVINRM